MDLGWIWTDNLRPLVAELAQLVGYQCDDGDWLAIEHGIQGTDSETDRWFEYPVGSMAVLLALEPGADEMVQVRVDGATGSQTERTGWLDAHSTDTGKDTCAVLDLPGSRWVNDWCGPAAILHPRSLPEEVVSGGCHLMPAVRRLPGEGHFGQRIGPAEGRRK